MKIGDVVSAFVDHCYPFGVFVRLSDGGRAYIRKRQLTLEGDVDPRDLLKKGDRLVARVYRLPTAKHMMELSVRDALPDPWPNFTRQHQTGDVVVATVKNLSHDRIYVQIVPGVDGYVLRQDLAIWLVEQTEALFWSEDRVEAVILALENDKKRVRLSIKQRQLLLSKAQAFLIDWSGTSGNDAEPEGEPPKSTFTLEGDELIGFDGRVMVVENEAELRNGLVKWLTDRGVAAEGDESGLSALEKLQHGAYQLAIVDLDMPVLDGLTLIHQLRQLGNSTPLAVMSDPELISNHVTRMQELNVLAAFAKPLDLPELQRFLYHLDPIHPVSLLSSVIDLTGRQKTQPLKQLTELMRSRQPLFERFQQGLDQLVNEIHAEMGIVFHLDSSSRVSITVHSGSLSLNLGALYALVDSPVRDVSEEGVLVWEEAVLHEHADRFRKLLDLLDFQSCVGVPVQACGHSEYSLFIFHRQPSMFSRSSLRDVQGMALLFAAALENQALDGRIQELSGIFLSGHLAAGFGHEVNNRLAALDLKFSNLRTDVNLLAKNHRSLRKSADFLAIVEMVDQAIETALELQQSVKGFRRLMESSMECGADINEVISLAEIQIRPLARRAQVEVRLNLGDGLPPVAGSRTALLQIFTNLMLNAVQHMQAKNQEPCLLQVTSMMPSSSGPLQVRISDSGPGIHRKLWEKIFELGFTTREGGSGLGLFMARSLVEAMGGRILVEESLMPIGTTFLVEVPLDADDDISRSSLDGK